MKGLDISGENLEDLLAYDDLFLDYFNAFLGLPVFPQALGYNRLTGAFEEIDLSDLSGSLSGCVSPSVHYGATTGESEKMLEWAREERLPQFLRTQLFRELKLCKLLLRPLDDRISASRNSSRQLRGYSRQSESYVSSLSNSADNSAEDVLDDEFGLMELRHSALYRFRRPGSRALSDPAGRIYYDIGEDYSDMSDTTSTGTIPPQVPRGHRNPSNGIRGERGAVTDRTSCSQGDRRHKMSSTSKRTTRISSEVEVFPSDPHTGVRSHSSKHGKRPPYSSTEEAFLRGARALSAPINYEEYLKAPFVNDFDALFGEAEPEPTGERYVVFEDSSDDDNTETDVRNMEGRLRMSLQQMKEQVLGTLSGMEAFRSFLYDTAGLSLLNFWLDCEFYKDAMQDEDEDTSLETRNRLFRDIQDKYKLNLTQDARNNISKSASNVGLSHTIFLRTQYDVLRRLRAYWVPRFLLHQERMEPFSYTKEDPQTVMWNMKKTMPKNPVPFFPSISLVRSMPLRPDDALSSSLTSNWDTVTKANTSRDIMSVQGRRPSSLVRHNGLCCFRPTKERFLLALSADRLAGGPFQKYLEKGGDQSLLSNLLFWEDVTEYGATEDKSADRLLRLQHAWAIFNKFLAHDSPYYVGLPDSIRDRIHQSLLEARDFVEASIYDSAKYQAVDRLEKAWIRFLKEDLKTFLDCRVRPDADSPPSTADAIEITVTDTEVVIKRPRPWVRRLQPLRVPGSTASERARRLQRALTLAEDIDFERRALNKKLRIERRKEMEKERKKAVKAAYARQKEAKLKKGSKSGEGVDGMVAGEGEDGVAVLPSYTDLHSNRQLMAMFRKFIQDGDSKELAHYLPLHNDLDTYFDMKDNKQKKDSHAGHIYKTYLDAQSKKFAPMPEKISTKVAGEKDRPKSATLKEVHKHVQSKLDELFKDFIMYQAEEFGVDPKDLASMSQAELTMRMGADTGTAWKKKNKGKATGRAHPTREDKIEFLKALGESAMGHLNLQMLFFFKYLVKHGPEDGMPLIDKDLFFYVEVQKFKDCSHAHSNDELLRDKVQSIVECFLESVTTPSLQVDITPETHTKTNKSTARYLQGKETGSNIFDEAQFQVFKELLPYWAGFMKSFAMDDKKKAPKTKYQKLVEKRMNSIQNYQMPSLTFTLPSIPEGAVPAFTITLSEGVKFKVSSFDSSSCQFGIDVNSVVQNNIIQIKPVVGRLHKESGDSNYRVVMKYCSSLL
ncbi:regulator of G-protein signaling 22-like isoform X1 [Haliotis asinina]|uniref:regulator of G-protein signaling 22-like isoform X1 n=1 Tax=Haliotis asinina TaxID=109174 RepID=UPI0035318CD2